jgi:Glutathione S-transferase, C-terminal domain
VKETNRLYGVLERRLVDRAFMAGDYSIADMATYPWIVPHERHGQKLENFPHLKRWFESIRDRPATVRAYELAKKINTKPTVNEESRMTSLACSSLAFLLCAIVGATKSRALVNFFMIRPPSKRRSNFAPDRGHLMARLAEHECIDAGGWPGRSASRGGSGRQRDRDEPRAACRGRFL